MRGQVQRAGPVVGAHRGVRWRIARAGLTARALIVAAGCGVFALAFAGPAQAAGTVPHANLTAVSCASETSCTAVGTGGTTFTTLLTLAEHWNGTSWTVQATPRHPSGATTASLSGVSCPSTRVCFAVGSLTISDGRHLVLASAGTGQGGPPADLQPTRRDHPSLTGVSCTSVSACTAVGNNFFSNTGSPEFVERWNGTTWALQTLPAPAMRQDGGPLRCRATRRPRAPWSASPPTAPEVITRSRSAGTGGPGRSKRSPSLQAAPPGRVPT